MNKLNSVQSLLVMLLFLAVVTVAGWQAWTPIQKNQTTATPPRIGHTDGSQVHGVRMMHFAENRIHWLLVAPVARKTEKKEVYSFEEPTLTVYRLQGPPIQVTAQLGEVDENTGNLLFRQQVIVVDNDRRLTTDELLYEQNSKRLHSDHSFQMAEPGSTIHGVGFNVYHSLREISVQQKVKVVFQNTVP